MYCGLTHILQFPIKYIRQIRCDICSIHVLNYSSRNEQQNSLNFVGIFRRHYGAVVGYPHEPRTVI
jgi:hypothetical protein